MNRLLPSWIATVLMLCAAPALAQDGEPTVGPDEACGHRYIGLREGNVCPQPPDDRWQLMQGYDADEDGPLESRLARYCIYQWAGRGSARPNLLPRLPEGRFEPVEPGNQRRSQQRWLQADCAAVTFLGDTDVPTWRGLFDAHLDATSGHWVNSPGFDVAQPTRVAVVDTTPAEFDNGRPGGGMYAHGRAVGLTIRRMTCSVLAGVSCATVISNHLGLPRVSRTQADRIDGGFFGYQSELGLAILGAVRQWRASPHSQLVINLSVGWNPLYGGAYPGANPETLPAPVRLVHDAIQYARCNGALVLAAAGNKAYDSLDDGPLYPAAWNTKAGPTGQDCAGITPKHLPALNPQIPDPLVTAIAGLRPDDRPLVSARTSTRTEIEAPGYHVAHFDQEIGEPTPILSGSSMATATASAIAAAAWAYAPDLAPAELAHLLYSTGVDLGSPPAGGTLNADVCLGGSCRTVRRISMCDAIEAACGLSGSPDCPAAFPCMTAPAYSDTSATLTAAEEAELDALTHTAEVAGTFNTSLAACGGQTHFFNVPRRLTKVSAVKFKPKRKDLCLQEAFYGYAAVPWTTPQPGGSGCDICYQKASDLVVRVNPADAAVVALKPQVIYDDAVHGELVYDLGSLDPALKELTPGDSYLVGGMPDDSTIKGIKVQYIIDDGKSQSLVVDEVHQY